MLDPGHLDRIAGMISFLQTRDTALVRDFQRNAYFARIPAGREIFAEGDRVDGIALMISGTVPTVANGMTSSSPVWPPSARTSPARRT